MTRKRAQFITLATNYIRACGMCTLQELAVGSDLVLRASSFKLMFPISDVHIMLLSSEDHQSGFFFVALVCHVFVINFYEAF